MNEGNQVLHMEEEIELSGVQRFFGIFVSPTKVFKSIRKNPKILMPLIIVPLAAIVFYLLFFKAYQDYILVTLEAQYEQMEIALTEDMAGFLTTFGTVTGIVVPPITIVVGMFFSAAYYWLGVKIFKGEVSYKQLLSLVAHVALIGILSWVVLGITNWLGGTFAIDEPATSLASFMPEYMHGGFLYGFMMNVEVFKIWGVILLGMGLAEIARISKSKAYILVCIAFLFSSLITGLSLWINTALM